MPMVDVYSASQKKVDRIDLKEEVFGAPVDEHLFYEVVKMQLANRRRGTAATKRRALVSGGGKKPWKQKGTGRARAGTTRSPLWAGGGITHGPRPRDYSYLVPKKVRRKALRAAVSLRAKEGRLLVVEGFELEKPATKVLARSLASLGATSALIVTGRTDPVLSLSARNLPNVRVLTVEGLNVRDVLRYEHLVLTRPAVEAVQARLAS